MFRTNHNFNVAIQYTFGLEYFNVCIQFLHSTTYVNIPWIFWQYNPGIWPVSCMPEGGLQIRWHSYWGTNGGFCKCLRGGKGLAFHVYLHVSPCLFKPFTAVSVNTLNMFYSNLCHQYFMGIVFSTYSRIYIGTYQCQPMSHDTAPLIIWLGLLKDIVYTHKC